MRQSAHLPNGLNSVVIEPPSKLSRPIVSSALALWRGSAAHRPFDDVLIYAVDDDPDLTELYTTLLARAGYQARAFNHRAEALAALMAEVRKPDLLITDYFGPAMHVVDFTSACRAAHPFLRILMASGYNQIDTQYSHSGADRFIRKPFTPGEFLDEVRISLDICSAASRVRSA